MADKSFWGFFFLCNVSYPFKFKAFQWNLNIIPISKDCSLNTKLFETLDGTILTITLQLSRAAVKPCFKYMTMQFYGRSAMYYIKEEYVLCVSVYLYFSRNILGMIIFCS